MLLHTIVGGVMRRMGWRFFLLRLGVRVYNQFPFVVLLYEIIRARGSLPPVSYTHLTLPTKA